MVFPETCATQQQRARASRRPLRLGSTAGWVRPARSRTTGLAPRTSCPPRTPLAERESRRPLRARRTAGPPRAGRRVHGSSRRRPRARRFGHRPLGDVEDGSYPCPSRRRMDSNVTDRHAFFVECGDDHTHSSRLDGSHPRELAARRLTDLEPVAPRTERSSWSQRSFSPDWRRRPPTAWACGTRPLSIIWRTPDPRSGRRRRVARVDPGLAAAGAGGYGPYGRVAIRSKGVGAATVTTDRAAGADRGRVPDDGVTAEPADQGVGHRVILASLE